MTVKEVIEHLSTRPQHLECTAFTLTTGPDWQEELTEYIIEYICNPGPEDNEVSICLHPK